MCNILCKFKDDYYIVLYEIDEDLIKEIKLACNDLNDSITRSVYYLRKIKSAYFENNKAGLDLYYEYCKRSDYFMSESEINVDILMQLILKLQEFLNAE